MANWYDYQRSGASGFDGGAPAAPQGTPGRRTLTAALSGARRFAAPDPRPGGDAGPAAGVPGAAPTLIVEDGQKCGPGQMAKSQFLQEASQLMPGQDLAPWLARSCGEIETAVRQQVTGAASARSARGYLDAIRAQAQAGGAAPTGAAFAAIDRARLGEAGARDHVRGGGLGEGAALPAFTRRAMEMAYGQGFGDVRVHTSEQASAVAGGLHARAFTVGHQIVFGAGQYMPGTPIGDALLAHELAHVAQQRGGSSSATGGVAHEEDADRAASHAMSFMYGGETASGATAAPALRSGVGVQRCPGGSSGSATATATATPLTFTSSAFTPGAGGAATTDVVSDPSQLIFNSAQYASSAAVAVAGGTNADAQGWDIGYLQTVRSSRRTGHYVGSPSKTKFEVTLPANTRDGNPAGVAPWYDSANPTAKHAVSGTGATENASLWDQPGMGFPWDTPDGQGKLDHTSGKDSFATWVVVRKRASPNTVQFINWETWEVNWIATTTYNSAGTKTATATGTTANTGSGAGQGSNSPNLTGSVANNVATGGWS
jgi:Domain of unknown function (DUF4157)